LEVSASQDNDAIFNLLDKVTKGISVGQIAVTQVGIRVTFTQNPQGKKIKARSFNLSYPNSCSLKNDGRDLIIRKMLTDSNVEPKEPNNT